MRTANSTASLLSARTLQFVSYSPGGRMSSSIARTCVSPQPPRVFTLENSRLMSPICAVTACTSPIAFCTAVNWSITRLKLSFICFSTAAWSCSFTVFWISASFASLPSRISRSLLSSMARTPSKCVPISMRC